MKQKEQSQGWQFGPYLLTGPQGQLLRRKRPLPLSPKAVAVLWTLASRTGQVVSKEELLTAVWPETVVSEGVITNCIGELRRMLGDTLATPRYIETVSRRGYRFLPTISTQPGTNSQDLVGNNQLKPEARNQKPEVRTSSFSTQYSALSARHFDLVGREAELAQLHHLLEKALTGERQLVFVTGEAGIGKTALVETFLQGLESRVHRQKENQKAKGNGQKAKRENQPPTPNTQYPTPWISRGQCIEHYGAGEAYLPILEALGRLCRQTEGMKILNILRQAAPTWLAQLPALLDETEYTALQRKVADATRERMLREMAEALETLTAVAPLVLVLEDLHWSDASTVDFLAMVARRSEAARLVILGTYRPAELVVTNHPLKRMKHELVAREQAMEVPLSPLAVEDVQRYLSRRFSQAVDMERLTSLIYRRTEGHPLFMVQVADYLTQRAGSSTNAAAFGVVEQALPQGLRELIEAQVGRLTAEERQTLEAASVAGAEFTAASVAAGAQTPVEGIERTCERLAQRGQFIEERGLAEWPDGTVSGQYGFRHVLYQEVLYKQLSVSRRVRLHQLVGVREETGYSKRAREHAAELAAHFEQGRDIQRAVKYFSYAGENAWRRSASQEAISLFTKGLALLTSLPESTERHQYELRLLLALSTPLMMTKGYTAPEVEQLSTRALELCQHVEQPSLLFSALTRLIYLHITRAEYHQAQELGAQYLQLAQQMPGVLPHLQAVTFLGITTYHQGEFVLSRQYLEEGLALCSSQRAPVSDAAGQPTSLVICLTAIAVALCTLGYPAQALTYSQEALALTHEHIRPSLRALALHGAFLVRRDRREIHSADVHAEALIRLCQEHGFSFWLAWGQMYQGWIRLEQGIVEEGVQLMQQGLAAVQAIGAEERVSNALAILAQAFGRAGQWEEGIAILDKALQHVSIHGEHYYEAEIYRLKGELTLQALQVSGSTFQVPRPKTGNQKQKTSNQSILPSTQGEAETCFLKAVDIARQQQAKSLELRATMSLSRLWRQQGKTKEAHQMLAEIYGWFTEGFDTIDLQEAKALLDVLI